MASVLTGVIAQILTDIETTSINAAYQGSVSGRDSNTPYAEVAIAGGDIDHTLTQVVEPSYIVSVSIFAGSYDELTTAIEELVELYDSGAKITALQALGVLIIYSTFQYTPPVYVSSTQQQYEGNVEYEMVISQTI